MLASFTCREELLGLKVCALLNSCQEETLLLLLLYPNYFLLLFQGIGVKIAEYILELREASPIKSVRKSNHLSHYNLNIIRQNHYLR